ncbi:MAG: sugar-binding protein [Bacteroidia bacterium]|nr:sugar-binding protein [Bacteroidia bacterium]
MNSAIISLLVAMFMWQPSTPDTLLIPFLSTTPVIDGNPDEWKHHAFHDGEWDIFRVSHTVWYESSRNRLTQHVSKDLLENDLSTRYYIAWDSAYLYLAAEVNDNFNDIFPHKPEPYRWYYKDAIAWFVESPADDISETFGEGDHSFCFVADPAKPANGAWWRHGNADTTYIEEPLPEEAVDYAIRRGEGFPEKSGNYTLEARINLALTFGKNNPDWQPPKVGDPWRMMIVHCDPDGGDYGGHLLIYGRGDDDQTWTPAVLGGEKNAQERKER